MSHQLVRDVALYFPPIQLETNSVHMPPSLLYTAVLGPTIRLIKSLGQFHRPATNQTSPDHTFRASKQNKTSPETIVGFLASREEIRAKPMANLRDTVRNRNQRSLLTARRRYKRRLPRQLEVEARVGATDEKDETKIARPDIQGANQHARTGCGEDDGDDDVVV